MENDQTPIIESSAAPEIQHDVPTPTPPPKNHKKLLWILGIALILAIATAITFAVLYFTKPTPEQPSNEAPTSEEEPPVSTDSEEVEITDTLLKQDLDEKIAILHAITEKGTLFTLNAYLYGHFNTLYTEGDLSEIAKLTHVVNSIQPDYILSYEEQELIAKEEGLEHNEVSEGVKAETVVEKYYDVFGKKLDKVTIKSQDYCPGVQYNVEYDFYYLIHRCGGTSPFTAYIYKNKYTTDGEHAYVYANVATLNGEDNKIYCDYISNSDNLPAVCGEYVNMNEFTIDENNYQDFAEYRFVFNKADNGTYYFVKVEKL